MPASKPRKPSSTPTPDAPAKKRAVGLYTIIAIKLGKALLLVAVALGLFSLMDDDLPATFDQIVRTLRLNPEWEFLSALGKQMHSITPANLGWLSGGALLYSLLLFVETGGLMFRGYWAAWLAIGETAFFIPIEIFDLVRHPTRVVGAVLVVNGLIVIYLARNRERLFHHHHAR
jgi:uncharacterized membrane protein (DUF2068 family)